MEKPQSELAKLILVHADEENDVPIYSVYDLGDQANLRDYCVRRTVEHVIVIEAECAQHARDIAEGIDLLEWDRYPSSKIDVEET